MASRKIEDLLPEVQDRFYGWLWACKEAGLTIILTCTYRRQIEQDAIFAQGRQPLATVNDLRKLANMAPITEKENVIRTKVKVSKHTSRRAADYAVVKTNGQIEWDLKADVNHDNKADYEQVGRIAQQCGLTWGGDWNGNGDTKDETLCDWCHVEAPNA